MMLCTCFFYILHLYIIQGHDHIARWKSPSMKWYGKNVLVISEDAVSNRISFEQRSLHSISLKGYKKVQKDRSAPSLKFGKVTHLNTLQFEHKTYPTCNNCSALLGFLSRWAYAKKINKEASKQLLLPNMLNFSTLKVIEPKHWFPGIDEQNAET